MNGYEKPLPEITDDNRGFWEAAAAKRELHLQQCGECGHIRYPVAPCCPNCLSERFRWSPVSGRGTVYSSVVYHQVYHAAFRDEVPYNVSMIQLEEGPRMISNVVGVQDGRVAVGTPVEVTFDQVTDSVAIPRFRIVTEG
ncbi:MAG: OB-fold domain-containing protein [Pseudomonadota bacterium]|nr:OB-fold domain-containing protein [Pseudomonadota bacterium]